MTDDQGSSPPSAEEIERRFRSLPVRTVRPLILSGIRTLQVVRRFGWSARGLENFRQLNGPIVLAANHLSHSDTAAILGTLPKPVRDRTAVAAALDVFGPKGKGRSWRNECLQLLVAAGFHAFAFDRHGPPRPSLRTSVELSRNGWNLLLYPEGTRSRSGQLGRFKSGVGVLARFTGCPVVPVYVHGGQHLLPQGVFLPRAAHITVHYGSPIYHREGESSGAFTQRLRDQICHLRGEPETAEEAALAAQPSPIGY